MIKTQNIFHKAQLYRLLMKISDNKNLAANIYFKGGTCAALLGFLDRFSVDLDFDLKLKADKSKLRFDLYKIFKQLNLTIKDESKTALQFFLKYDAQIRQRNSIKLDIIDNSVKANQYKPQYLKEIDRTLICQTIETMFANKLVALIDRYEKTGALAGRDLYDIHYFFIQGYDYNKKVIEERRRVKTVFYLKELKKFIDQKITETIINQDLNLLLPYDKFKVIGETLKTEVLMLLRDEIKRIEF